MKNRFLSTRTLLFHYASQSRTASGDVSVCPLLWTVGLAEPGLGDAGSERGEVAAGLGSWHPALLLHLLPRP